MNKTSIFVRSGARLMAACLGLLSLAVVQAQTPVVTPSPAAAEALLGEQFCFDVPWTNTGAPGYGPYLRVLLPPEVPFESAQMFGSALNVVTNATFPAAPGTLTDPLFLPATAPGNQVTAPEGWRMVILEMPLGSVVANGPDLVTELCVSTKNTTPDLAQIGVPYPIEITPLYRYGDSPTGSSTEAGSTVNPTITPQVLILTKENTAPEDERPPGPVWQYDYVLSVDIASAALISPLTLTDTLPPNVQFVGPVTITGGDNCSTTTPSTTTPGGELEVVCSGTHLGAPGGGDVVVSFPVYITDILDETGCGTQLLTNTATANAEYLPAGGGAAIVLP